MSIIQKIITKTIKTNSDDFMTVTRIGELFHGPFFVTLEDGRCKWGNYRFNQLHGPISTFFPEFKSIATRNYHKGKKDDFEIISVGENQNGVPYVLNEVIHDHEDDKIVKSTRTYKVAFQDRTLIQKVLIQDTNKTILGKATPETVSLIYEPTTCGSIYPAVVNSFKEIEFGKVYTRWYRTDNTGKMFLIGMARSSATENLKVGLGYDLDFEEIVVFQDYTKNPLRYSKSNPTFEERFQTFAAEKFGSEEYEELKADLSNISLEVEFKVSNDKEETLPFGYIYNENQETKFFEKVGVQIDGVEVDLLLFDLQRGSGNGAAQVRAHVATYIPETGKGEVPNPNGEDAQGSGEEAPSVPAGNEDGANDSTDASEGTEGNPE